MKLMFPVVLAAAWIVLVAMTLTDFAAFASATQPARAAAAKVRERAARPPAHLTLAMR